MKRRLRILLSRFTLVALTIIALFLAGFLVVAGAFYLLKLILEAVFVSGAEWIDLIFRAVGWIVVVATAIHIINRNMMPEAKVLWLLCIVAFNAFGVAIYAVFSYNRPSRRQRKKFLALKEEAHKFTRPTLSKEELVSGMGRWAAVSRALYTKNEHAVVYRGTDTKYYPTGEVQDYPAKSTSIGGGNMHSVTVGANYSFNKYAQVLLEYTWNRLDRDKYQYDKNIHTLQARLLFSF